MLFRTYTTTMHSHLNPLKNPTSISSVRIQFTASISSLKVAWRKDQKLDQAIENDKQWRLCARVVKEVLNEPGQVIPLRYLEKRRERLRLPISVKVFLSQNPSLFDKYLDRIKPKSEPVPFIRVSEGLQKFLEEEERINLENEPLIVQKLCKLLMMAKDRVISADKLVHVKREFGFPNDLLVNLVPKYPAYFRLVGCPGEGKTFLELASWNCEFAKSVIEIRCPYISPYEDASNLDLASREMEKRTVGVFHELLSLSLYKRIPVPILGKFCEEYRFSNAFFTVFTRHSGIFYMSLKGGIKTAMLREAYKDDELIDRDPLLEIKDKFVELLDEGHRNRMEQLRVQSEAIHNDMEMVAIRNNEFNCNECKDL